ncbi:hypothetical protein EMPS_10466 [Entomortierella parvispora]|uniref:G domain-containing protein n=1 Tax=Entomortierella parvispora TaxID=205924 RepID=A0A9P3HKW7_9FUNG|nr:hypothetical protein EMPS_10466 [Entomortierella parvispora]
MLRVIIVVLSSFTSFSTQSSPTAIWMASEMVNILVLGETQSGKSTLVEALKLYADPKYNVNSSKIGSGNISKTMEVVQEAICTPIPRYSVFLKTDFDPHSKLLLPGKEAAAHEYFILNDKELYEQQLNDRKHFRQPVPLNDSIDALNLSRNFNIIDTPGLNDTSDRDEDHVSKIFSAIGAKSLNLVLVTVSRGAFTQGLKQTLRSYLDLFPQLGDIIAFVHTRVNYLDLHPGMTDFQTYMKQRTATLNDIMGRDSIPHFWIDCDFESTKPIRKCITNNTLRKILKLADGSEPVPMLYSETVNKTPKMKEIDQIIKSQVQAVMQAIESTLEFKDSEEGRLLRGVYLHATKINELQSRIELSKDLRKSYQTDELGLLFQERFDDFQKPYAMDELRLVKYEGYHQIEKQVVWTDYFYRDFSSIIGELQTNWHHNFRKMAGNYSGYYHVKLYAKKSSRFACQIDALSSEIEQMEQDLEQAILESDQQPKELLSRIQSFVDEHNQHMEVIRLATADTLHRDLFVQLLHDEAFAGPQHESSEKVARSYRRFAAKRIQHIHNVPTSPFLQTRDKDLYQVLARTPELCDAIDNEMINADIQSPLQKQMAPQSLPYEPTNTLPPSGLQRRRARVGPSNARNDHIVLPIEHSPNHPIPSPIQPTDEAEGWVKVEEVETTYDFKRTEEVKRIEEVKRTGEVKLTVEFKTTFVYEEHSVKKQAESGDQIEGMSDTMAMVIVEKET